MESNNTKPNGKWTSVQAYSLALVCLLVGLPIGYVIHSSGTPAVNSAVQAPGMNQAQPAAQAVSPEFKEREQALLAKLQSDPRNVGTLTELGNLYMYMRQFPQAVELYAKALEVNAGDADIRTDLGSAYWYMGEGDKSVAEFETILKSNPEHADALFNYGMVQWQGKGDVKAAVESWTKFLELHPRHPKSADVKQWLERAKNHVGRG